MNYEVIENKGMNILIRYISDCYLNGVEMWYCFSNHINKTPLAKIEEYSLNGTMKRHIKEFYEKSKL